MYNADKLKRNGKRSIPTSPRTRHVIRTAKKHRKYRTVASFSLHIGPRSALLVLHVHVTRVSSRAVSPETHCQNPGAQTSMVEYPPLARSTSVQRGNGNGWDRLHALMLLSRCRMHAMLAERKAPNRPSRSSRCQHEEAMATKSMDPWHQLAGSPSRRREPIAHIAVRNAPHGHISQAAPCTRPARALAVGLCSPNCPRLSTARRAGRNRMPEPPLEGGSPSA